MTIAFNSVAFLLIMLLLICVVMVITLLVYGVVRNIYELVKLHDDRFIEEDGHE